MGMVSLSIIMFVLVAISKGATISITSNAGSTEWWLAYSISDSATTAVELQDAGNYNEWTQLTATNWGYWIFASTGSAVVFPVSIRLSSGTSQITVVNAFLSSSPGLSLDTGASYSAGSITVTPGPPLQNPTLPAFQPTLVPTTQPPTSDPAQPSLGNLFATTDFYINPHYTSEVDSAIESNPTKSAMLSSVKLYASAFWIDRQSALDNILTRDQGQRSGRRVMAALVVYNLPTRDCAALASNGEIKCVNADCVEGINKYKYEYIDQLVAILQQFPEVGVVTIIEPDSIPNLATNLGTPNCALAQIAYKTGVAYAVQQLATLSNVAIYVDAAHGGWLGWEDGRTKAVSLYSEILALAGGPNKIRGFATNVANYQPLGSMSDAVDPCKLSSQYNFAINEVKYVSLLDSSLAAVGITGMHYVIDTSRNGVTNARSDCSNCFDYFAHINGAGLGIRPTSNTSSSGLSNIDAYFWIKPPGESDGTSDSSAVRFDAHCGSADSAKPAPEAGNWYSSYFVMLAENANPPL